MCVCVRAYVHPCICANVCIRVTASVYAYLLRAYMRASMSVCVQVDLSLKVKKLSPVPPLVPCSPLAPVAPVAPVVPA